MVPPRGLAARAAIRQADASRPRGWTLTRDDGEPPAIAYLHVAAVTRWAWGLPRATAEALAECAAVLTDNGFRHSAGSHVTVTVAITDGRATVAVQDDGPARAFPPPSGYGTGLRHIEARADAWGHHTTAGGGTRVHASITLPEET
uniref:ATP-binding protein n=1 Tax=unclassified Streptomyces TaxID=2593676 RepID=UPI003F498D90